MNAEAYQTGRPCQEGGGGTRVKLEGIGRPPLLRAQRRKFPKMCVLSLIVSIPKCSKIFSPLRAKLKKQDNFELDALYRQNYSILQYFILL